MVRRLGSSSPVKTNKVETAISPPVVISKNDMPFTLTEVGKVGEGTQLKIAESTSSIVDSAKTSDMDEVGKLLQDTIMAAKGYDPNNLFKGGFLGFFKAKTHQIRAKFDSVDDSVNKLVQQIDQRVDKFRSRITDLEKLSVSNKEYHDSLTGQIDYLNERADWMDANHPVPDPEDALSAEFLQDWLTVINFARKRADDLRRAQLLSQQQGAQIQQMKLNSTALAQKFSDIKVTTVPAMKQTFTLYVINMEQKKGAEFADSIDSTNNEILQKNAEMLGQNTTAIHTSLTRSNITIETLQKNHESIINSLDEVKRINDEMKSRIKEEAPKLEALSQDLTTKLSQS